MTKTRNWQLIGESLPKELNITEFWMDGEHIVLTSQGIWAVLRKQEL